MDIKVFPGKLSGTVRAITSKSQAHRAFICATLADKPTFIEYEGTSKDIIATADCLSALGANIICADNGCTVQPIKPENCMPKEGDAVSPMCGESGSTFRFLLPLAGSLGIKAKFFLEGRLPERPLSPLYEELVNHGCALSPQGSNPFYIEGKLKSGEYSLDAGVSSQFISGLLFALPLLEGDSELRLTGKIESFPYIELTISMLEKFGVKINFNNNIFSISGKQKYISPEKLSIEGDWSNAAFWLTAGALCETSITCEGLNLQSKQGDMAILEILARFGAKIEKSGSSVTVYGKKQNTPNLRGIEINAADIPDLVPILTVAAAAAEGKTVIRNAGRLRAKESDRLAAISSVLNELGADVRVTEDGLIINGRHPLKGGKVSSWNDHRIAMSAAIAASVCGEPVEIQGAEAVKKSYPNFFDDYKKLGGNIE